MSIADVLNIPDDEKVIITGKELKEIVYKAQEGLQ